MPKTKKTPSLLPTIVELVLISLWALWVGRKYLNFDPTSWPTGRELGLVIRTHYIWTLLPRCGTCMLWNGSINGGGPAFAEIQGAILHPLVILTTLLWGVINGTKILLISSLAMAGWAQLWLARVIGLGRTARVWSAAMAVVGGHLAARMEHGVVGLVLSTAACSLVIPPALDLAMTGRRKTAVLTAITLALALLSGQGYMQFGLLLGVFPALMLIGLISKNPRRGWAIKGFVASGLLALLMIAILWSPVLYALPYFVKDTDPALASTQPLEYLPLNLVIRDIPYYYTRLMGRLPYPYLYANYIGWIPVILAVLALGLASSSSKRRYLWTLGLTVGTVYLCASAVLLKPMLSFAPALVAGIRYPTVISGLAVPPILALAGAGLDQSLGHFKHWLSRKIHLSTPRKLVNLGVLALAFPLVWSIQSAYTFSSTWLTVSSIGSEIYRAAMELRTPTAQWIAFPYGQHFWAIPAFEAGIKLTNVFSPWHWKGREPPKPYLKYDGDMVTSLSSSTQRHTYAYVDTNARQIPCQATALGGRIDVTCDTPGPGTLVVLENQWPDWHARRDGVSVDFIDNVWLSVYAPAGEHQYSFRYQPLHVYLGLLVTVLGCALAAILWQNPVASLPWIAPMNRYVDARLSTTHRILRGLCRRSQTLLVKPLSRQQARSIVLWTSGIAAISLTALVVISLEQVRHASFLKQSLSVLFVLASTINGIIWFKLHHREGPHK